MRKVLKVFLYIIGIIIVLIVGVVVWLNTPSGENFVRVRAQVFLQNKLKTPVLIGKLGYGLPKFIVLENVLIRDQKNDTLLDVGKLKVDLDMLKLIHKEIDVNQLVLQGVHSHIYRNAPDTNFNFSYIITAFAGKKPANPEVKSKKVDTAGGMSINVDRVELDDIHARVDDATGGMKLGINLQHLELKIKNIDLKHMKFHVKELNVAGLQTLFYSDTSYLPVKPKSTAQTQCTLIADNINLKQIGFKYKDNLNKLLFNLDLAGLQVKLDKFDLVTQVVNLAKFSIDTTNIKLAFGKKSKVPAPVDSIIKMDTVKGWNVAVKDLAMAGVSFAMDNENDTRLPSGIDYNHLNIQGLAVHAQDIKYTSDTIAGNIKHLAVKEQSGLDVKELRTRFLYQPQGATLSNLYLLTSNTVIQDSIQVKYPSLDALKKNMGLMELNVNIRKSVIGLRDVLVFMPSLIKQPLVRKYQNGHLQLDAGVSGYMGNLAIARFNLSGLENTEVSLSGRLSGLPNPKAVSYNLNIAKLQSSRNDVAAFVPPATLSSIRIPDRFGITGKISGTEKDYNPDLLLVSSDGAAYVRGYLHMGAGKGREQYNLFVKTMALNVGRILKKDSIMSTITSYVTVKGQGFDVKTMSAALNGGIQSAHVKGYDYNSITFNGNVAHKVGDIKLASTDANLHMNMIAHADMSGKYAAVKADLQADSIDFQALKLYSSELKIHGDIHADFPELNPDYPKGELIWRKPLIVANGQRYLMDSLYVLSRPSADTGQYIIANLDVMQAVIIGKTPLTKLGAIIQDHINRHYSIPVSDSAKQAIAAMPKKAADTSKTNIPADYNLAFTAHVEDRPLLHSLLAGLTSLDTIHVDGSLTPRNLTLNATAPNVVYGSNTIQNGVVKVTGTDSAFTYKVTVDKIATSQLALWYANIHGNLDQNTITTNISLSDSVKKERFALVASLQNAGDSQIIQLQPGLKLDYQPWVVTEPNRIDISKAGFYVSNFNISNNNQYIKINSDQPVPNTPLKVDISNFLLANITQMISKDTALANGILGGNITIQKIKPTPVLSGDLQIQNLSVMGDTIGNLSVKVNTQDGNTFDTKVGIKGNGNDMALSGNYYLQPVGGNSFNFALAMNALSLASVQGLAMNQIRNSSGFIRGNLQLQGTPSAPVMNGELRTDNLATTVSMLNAYFKLPADKITFSSSGITFNNFEILDSTGNKATVNGTVGTQDLKNPKLDLKLDAQNWHALHSTAKDNKVFYGDLFFTSKLNVQGTPSSPNVDGSIGILKGTNMTVVLPESDPGIVSSAGIVEFIDVRNPERYKMLVSKPRKDSTKVALNKGSNINVNIAIDKAAGFNVIIDQASGDFLSVKGDGALNASVTPGGTFGLTGTYEMSEGAYQLNYNFIKRKFLIQKGSTITFSGDPSKANADINAVYEVDAPAYDLVQGVASESDLTYFKQNLPFNVAMHIKGSVVQPSLTFDVILPENKVYPLSATQIELIQGKLAQIRNDTSELNKQVFALIILSRFVSDNPFTNGAGGGGAAFAAKQSASRFIGEQLNQFANHLVKGVDLDVDLASTEDYTTGTMRDRTDLNLAASKRLLNDRLKLTIGNDFELEGPQTTNSDQNNLIPSNLAVDYLLSPDGRYTVRAYRKNYNEGVLEGYVTESGVNFIVSLNFNHFKNAIKKRDHKKEQSDGKKEQTNGASK
jgi:translocation and assembly module TamB